jgi:hypothetical protein
VLCVRKSIIRFSYLLRFDVFLLFVCVSRHVSRQTAVHAHTLHHCSLVHSSEAPPSLFLAKTFLDMICAYASRLQP